ncbi:hypothetical protein SASPL_108250 [Salvia splendens]|uniref:Uncharacterized protein n=1 Tax=Salvia splendens TaxID=180675 RepID=A0A8X8YIG2_SALSN|nr:hypothetical protein SASPL_108250 [Salvia splendens]
MYGILGSLKVEDFLQQWFEYCPNSKKRSCPICKQACTNANVGRLYFQSIGDSSDTSQKPRDCQGNPEELQREVNRLEGKFAALSSSLEKQQKDFQEVKDELLTCSEQLKTEVALKHEAVLQTATAKRLLRAKSEELDKSTMECMRFKERNMALARELATFRLSYKELLAKCNDLGRREARCCEELENANKKIKKLKPEKNDALRVLKDQNIKLKRNSHDNQMKRPTNQAGLDDIPDISFVLEEEEFPKNVAEKCTINDKLPGFAHDPSAYKTSTLCADDNVIVEECHDPRPVQCFHADKNDVELVNSDYKAEVSRSLSLKKSRKRQRAEEVPSNIDDEVICTGDTNNPVQTPVHNGKETSSSNPVSEPDNHYFTGGLLGPDGTNWHLGKWCKKGQNQGSNSKAGDLIAVGADGRGGRIKAVVTALRCGSLEFLDQVSGILHGGDALGPTLSDRDPKLLLQTWSVASLCTPPPTTASRSCSAPPAEWVWLIFGASLSSGPLGEMLNTADMGLVEAIEAIDQN